MVWYLVLDSFHVFQRLLAQDEIKLVECDLKYRPFGHAYKEKASKWPVQLKKKEINRYINMHLPVLSCRCYTFLGF